MLLGRWILLLHVGGGLNSELDSLFDRLSDTAAIFAAATSCLNISPKYLSTDAAHLKYNCLLLPDLFAEQLRKR